MISKLFGLKRKAHVGRKSGHRAGTFSFLGTDLHSHIIPGIDDGAQTLEDSIEMVKHLQKMGFNSLITTPHIRQGHFNNTPATVHQGLHLLQHALKEEGINIPVKAAGEYFVDEAFLSTIENKEPLLTFGNNEVLIEFSFVFEPSRIFNILEKIQNAGYVPVLAHAERYTFYHNNSAKYQELKSAGCLLQLNLMSLASYYGSKVKTIAENILQDGLFDYCGSDVHHNKHLESLQKLLRTDSMYLIQDYPFANSKL
jgi:protein-tyrosine phosphatase